MGMVLKHIQKKGGSWRYRRKVPAELRSALGKGEIVLPLGRTEGDALRRYPAIHAEAERALEAARRQVAAAEGLIVRQIETPFDRYDRTRKRLRELGFDPDAPDFDASEELRGVAADHIGESYPADPETDDPVGVTPEDTELVTALRSSVPIPPPPPTLEDAKRLYIQDRFARSKAGPKARRRDEQRADRVVAHVVKALGRNPKLTDLWRSDARKVHDHMLKGDRSAATAERELNDLRAIINHAIRELDISDFNNPFTNLEAAPTEGPELARTKRRPFTGEELTAVRERVATLTKGSDLKLVWRLLEGTGCRLAEVTGLRVQDVHTDGDLPFLLVEWHEDRRVKTAVSQRRVPLVGDALQAAIEARQSARQAGMMFSPRYAGENGPNSASAALMKHVRAVAEDPKVTVHSLRHNMKDRLRLAGVSPSVQDMILGHSSGKVGDDYGCEAARLKVASEAMRKIESPASRAAISRNIPAE